MGNQALGQGFDVGVGDGEGEQQFQQFVVWQGPGPAQRGSAAAGGPGGRDSGVFPVVQPSLLLLRWWANCNYEKGKGGHLGPPRQIA